MEFKRQHLAELEQLDVPRIARPERFWLLVETGDEVLDYRQAVRKYAGARQTVTDGGDHSFRHFSDFLDAIVVLPGSRRPDKPCGRTATAYIRASAREIHAAVK